MSAAIINDRVEGTRITVWDIYHYLDGNWTDELILGVLPITNEQLQVAKQYIEANRDYVHEGHQRIEERIARGNSPEVQQKQEESRRKVQAWLAQRKEQADARIAR
jgi:uncharacterized protein (DUF433 family)